MREIRLASGAAALVDDDRFDELNKFKWHSEKAPRVNSGPQVYAARREPGTRRRVFMHRAVAGTPAGMHTDHINGNGLDNRRANLRVCTSTQNQWNQRQTRPHSSKFKNVSWNKSRRKWKAQLMHRGRHIHVGWFGTEEEAARARDVVALRLRGEYAVLNSQESI